MSPRGYNEAPQTETEETVQEIPEYLRAARWAGAVAIDRDMSPAQGADWDRIVPETPVD